MVSKGSARSKRSSRRSSRRGSHGRRAPKRFGSARKVVMTDAAFQKILIDVRDGILATMRRDGFYSVLPEKRFDEPAPWDVNNGLCDEFAYGVQFG